MQIEFESGHIIEDPTVQDLGRIEREDFAILSSTEMNYLQCAHSPGGPPLRYVLEYQDGSLDEHYEAIDGPITLQRVTAAFRKYLGSDPSWKDDFQWRKIDLSGK